MFVTVGSAACSIVYPVEIEIDYGAEILRPAKALCPVRIPRPVQVVHPLGPNHPGEGLDPGQIANCSESYLVTRKAVVMRTC